MGETLFMFVSLKVGARATEGKGEGRRRRFSVLSSRPLPAPFDSPHFLSLGSFKMGASRAKTFARPKKTPALQAKS